MSAVVGAGSVEENARRAAVTTPVHVRARVAWARHQGHPDYLWPDVPIDGWRRALHGIEEALRAVLTGRAMGADASIAPALAATGVAQVRALGVAAFTSGTGPLLGRWIEEGLLRAGPEATALLGEHLRQGRLRAARMEGHLRGAVDALTAAGVRPLVLKGLHTGAELFPEPGTRPSADIDLAVRPAEGVRAEGALASLGWSCTSRRASPHRSEWSPPGGQTLHSLELTHADNPLAIDLHAGIDRDFLGVRRLRFGEDPFDAAVPLAGVQGAFALSHPHLLLFLAAHASEEFHRLQLLRLVELVFAARRDLATPAARTALRDRARELEAGRFILPALLLAERLVPGTFQADWLAELRAAAPPRMSRILEPLRPADAQRLESLALRDRFLFVHGPVEWFRRTAFLLWPARSRRVGTVYAERIWRVLRGRVSLGAPDR